LARQAEDNRRRSEMLVWYRHRVLATSRDYRLNRGRNRGTAQRDQGTLGLFAAARLKQTPGFQFIC
jgi:hypothetical protein